MPQAKKGQLNFRCPNCFVRDIDMDMFYDAEKEEYYCLRCGFVGKKQEVLDLNERAKHKYRFLSVFSSLRPQPRFSCSFAEVTALFVL